MSLDLKKTDGYRPECKLLTIVAAAPCFQFSLYSVGVEAFSIFTFSVSLSAPEFVVSKFTWRFSKSFSVHRQI